MCRHCTEILLNTVLKVCVIHLAFFSPGSHAQLWRVIVSPNDSLPVFVSTPHSYISEPDDYVNVQYGTPKEIPFEYSDLQQALAKVRMARDYLKLDMEDEAESLLLQAIFLQARMVRPEDQDLCFARVEIAKLYLQQGRLLEAEEQLEAVIEALEYAELLGLDAVETATWQLDGMGMDSLAPRQTPAEALTSAKVSLARVYAQQGLLEDAEQLTKEVKPFEQLELVTYAIGELYHDLGTMYSQHKQYDKASKALELSLAVNEAIRDVDGNGFLIPSILRKLAVSYVWQGRVSAAQLMAHRSVLEAQDEFGEVHWEVAWSLELLGSIYLACQDKESAIDLLAEALRMNYDLLGTGEQAGPGAQGSLKELQAKVVEAYEQGEGSPDDLLLYLQATDLYLEDYELASAAHLDAIEDFLAFLLTLPVAGCAGWCLAYKLPMWAFFKQTKSQKSAKRVRRLQKEREISGSKPSKSARNSNATQFYDVRLSPCRQEGIFWDGISR